MIRKLGLICRLIGFFNWKIGKHQYRIKTICDNPNSGSIKNNIIYVVGGEDYVKWAYLQCPSGCKEIIMLNLNRERNPSWKISQDRIGKATIYPSIHKQDGCQSHFWIKKGKLKWADADY